MFLEKIITTKSISFFFSKLVFDIFRANAKNETKSVVTSESVHVKLAKGTFSWK